MHHDVWIYTERETFDIVAGCYHVIGILALSNSITNSNSPPLVLNLVWGRLILLSVL